MKFIYTLYHPDRHYESVDILVNKIGLIVEHTNIHELPKITLNFGIAVLGKKEIYTNQTITIKFL